MRTAYTILALIFNHLLLGQQIELINVVDGTFAPETVDRVNWMNDGEYYTALEDNTIKQYSIKTGLPVRTLVDGTALGITINDYEFSSDEQKMLLLTDRQSIYRRSFVGIYYAYDLAENRLLTKVSEQPCSYATFSAKGTHIAYVQANNIYITDLSENIPITDDGAFNEIINGSADWVYEEELYLTKAFAWSSDGDYIAFIKFDESQIPVYNLQYWDEGSLYPRDYQYKYPKAGEKNSVVSVWIHHIPSGTTQKADLGSDVDVYYPRVSWTPDGQVSVQKLNRWQNIREVFHVDPSSGASQLVLSETSETYVHLTFCDDLTYLSHDRFLYSSERDGNKHFYLYRNDGTLINQITTGDWTARSVIGVDENKDVLYYLSTEGSPLERHLYSIRFNGKQKRKITQDPGVHAIDMSPDTKYYMDFFSAAGAPPKVQLFDATKQKMIKDLVTNSVLADTQSKYDLRKKEFFTFETSEGVVLNGYYLKPPAFDAAQEYPLLIFQYSGPGSQNVMNSWGGSHFIWHQMLAQRGYIVAVVDPRGTGGRGADFKKMTYQQLGKYEAIDHLEAARYFADLPYVDGDRLGIWGWSYGGYISSLAMFLGEGLFKAAIAVAPVTSWRFYDTIYTERYLRRPQDNPDGYDANSPLTHADKLQGEFLLIHGTGDDNVHFANSVALQEQLIRAKKQFQSFYYPDRAHGLRGPGGRYHLYEMMTNFIEERL